MNRIRPAGTAAGAAVGLGAATGAAVGVVGMVGVPVGGSADEAGLGARGELVHAMAMAESNARKLMDVTGRWVRVMA